MSTTTPSDLSNCDREPVQKIGAIQPHGVLLVFDAGTEHFVQASDNTEQFFSKSAHELLGKPVDDIAEPRVARLFKTMIANAEQRSLVPLTLPTSIGQTNCTMYRMVDGIVVLEFEPRDEVAPDLSADRSEHVNQAAGALNACDNSQELLEQLAEAVKKISGYDRVMAYRFDEEWNGQVVVDLREDGMESWLGFRYPPSDIPAPARELFTKNWSRMIVTTEFEPVSIIPPVNFKLKDTIDLTFSALRAPSPVHVEYLRNMKVAASFTVSLICNGRLWGMVACHHREPRFLNFWIRSICEVLAKISSQKISTWENEERKQKEIEMDTILAKIGIAGASVDSVAQLLEKEGQSMLGLFDSSGLAHVSGDTVETLGTCPPDSAILDMVSLVRDTQAGVVALRCLADQLPEAHEYAAQASGMLGVRIRHPKQSDYLLWFRPEILEQIDWGGNPHKIESTSEDGRIHPRKSFAKWTETVRGKSARWTNLDVQASTRLARLLESGLSLADIESNYPEQIREEVIRTVENAIVQLHEMSKEANEEQKRSLRSIIQAHRELLSRIQESA